MTMILALVVLGVVVLLVAVGFSRTGMPEQPGWHQGSVPVGVHVGSGQGVWNAQILGGGVIGAMGGTLNSTFGTFYLDNGLLAFVPDGASAAIWSAPCPQITVTHSGIFSVATVRLQGPMGEICCNVSVERINRMSRNSFKTIRESRHAQHFAAALRANGAR